MIIDSTFKPAWWLRNAHLQTILAKSFKKNQQLSLHQTTLETPDDDFLDLVWTELPESSNTKPIIVILHGLEGSAESHYAKGMLAAIKQQGWIGLLMHFRGCSGRPNRKAQSYHSGDTRDITFISEWLAGLYPDASKAAVGFSLGGNALTRYLAQTPNNPFQTACIICAPLDLSSCSQRISQGSSKIYQKYLVDMLKTSTFEKMEQQLLPDICPDKLAAVDKLWDFDQMVTAPINGFTGAEHYYQQASGKPVMHKINRPCLFIHAADDPFLSHQDIVPNSDLPEHLTFEISEKGGHVGFVTGNNPLKPVFWLEQRVPQYLKQFL
ncbi:hydrolase [Thalassotalea sp. M1531]|uniref:Hydrolase n=1 Tax=Thalassotalea algicola TaxID=2716224 RepID=A0A7Y0LC79_9GAMM|nr:hydrolase [Thalassotalea algicola]NMP30415.1 hydrolase [Thalassotalea algicola]